MNDHEKNWDARLRICTSGRDDTHSDAYRYPYEPTPYAVLERLADSGLLGEGNVLLDYGCGKGRVDFFLAHVIKLKAIGVEYDEGIFRSALENRETAVSGEYTEFILTRAEAFSVPPEVDSLYFFNPFSVEILRKVMAEILNSYYDTPREILLFFYYPSDEYISYLMTVDELDFYDEIDCGDLFAGNEQRERILIFSLPEFPS